MIISDPSLRNEQIEKPSPERHIHDATLINGCLDGDEQAWELLLTRYGKLIYTIPLRFGFDQSIADEVFQEVCLILLEKLHTLRETERFKGWLVTTTRRACLQRLRHQRLAPLSETADAMLPSAETPEALMVLTEQQELVHHALSTLDDRCQQLLWALFFADSTPSYSDLAELLERPVGSIGPLRSRCLEKLRAVLLELDQV